MPGSFSLCGSGSVPKLCPALVTLWTVAYPGLHWPWDSPGEDTGDSQSPELQVDSLQLGHQGSKTQFPDPGDSFCAI